MFCSYVDGCVYTFPGLCSYVLEFGLSFLETRTIFILTWTHTLVGKKANIETVQSSPAMSRDLCGPSQKVGVAHLQSQVLILELLQPTCSEECSRWFRKIPCICNIVLNTERTLGWWQAVRIQWILLWCSKKPFRLVQCGTIQVIQFASLFETQLTVASWTRWFPSRVTYSYKTDSPMLYSCRVARREERVKETWITVGDHSCSLPAWRRCVLLPGLARHCCSPSVHSWGAGCLQNVEQHGCLSASWLHKVLLTFEEISYLSHTRHETSLDFPKCQYHTEQLSIPRMLFAHLSNQPVDIQLYANQNNYVKDPSS